jgi:hypothetical protein
VHPAQSRAPQPRLVPGLRRGRLYDFVEERTHDGRKFRMLNIIDEFTHECLAIRVSRRLKSIDVIDVLSDLFILAERCADDEIAENLIELARAFAQRAIKLGADQTMIPERARPLGPIRPAPRHGQPLEESMTEALNPRTSRVRSAHEAPASEPSVV